MEENTSDITDGIIVMKITALKGNKNKDYVQQFQKYLKNCLKNV